MIRCVAVALSVFAVSVAHAQAGVVSGSMTGYVGPRPQRAEARVPVAVAFDRKTMQTLSDGTHISRTTHEWFYRDAQGRTRTEFELNSAPGMPEAPRKNVIVYDPVGGQSLSWMTGQNVPQMYTLNKIPVQAAHRVGVEGANVNPGLRPAPRPASPQPPANPLRETTFREDLGTQEVQGAPCKATRTTTIYPIDMLGNDRPITVVKEFCMSHEFGLVLSEHTDDPRNGIGTRTVTSLSRTDPDPALFQPPAGYTERPHVDVQASGTPVTR